jgi:hypothetical protein
LGKKMGKEPVNVHVWQKWICRTDVAVNLWSVVKWIEFGNGENEGEFWIQKNTENGGMSKSKKI